MRWLQKQIRTCSSCEALEIDLILSFHMQSKLLISNEKTYVLLWF